MTYDVIRSQDRQELVDGLYKLSRADNRKPPSDADLELAPILIGSEDDEIAWRSIILFGIIFPSKIAIPSLLEAVKKWTGSNDYIGLAAVDALNRIKDTNSLELDQIRNIESVLQRAQN